VEENKKEEIRGILKEELKKIIASPFCIEIEYGTSVVSVAIARSRKPGANSSKEPEDWYRDFANGVAFKHEASFRTAIDEEGNLVYDGFFWSADHLMPVEKGIRICVAAMKDFMAGVSAAGQIDLDQAVNAARLSAALKAAAASVCAKRGDRGDNL
jgi:hypothetical protein